MPLPTQLRWILAIAFVSATVACNDPLALPPPQSENVVDTVTIHALRGTALTLPSGFDIVSRAPTRTDRAEPFDFAFDINDAGVALLYPAAVLGVSTDAALLVSTQDFTAITTAPTEGFQRDSAVSVSNGTVVIARSRTTNQACSILGSLPRYGKFRILTVDATTRAVTIETLINTNCGYRDLEPGLPES